MVTDKEHYMKLLALAIDTEGSLCVTLGRPHKNLQHLIETRALIYFLTNKNLEVCQYIKSIAEKYFDGTITIKETYTVNKGVKYPFYIVQVWGQRNVCNILKELIPYLIVKKDKAIKVLTLLESRQGKAGIPFSIEDKKTLLSLKDRMDRMPDWQKEFYKEVLT